MYNLIKYSRSALAGKSNLTIKNLEKVYTDLFSQKYNFKHLVIDLIIIQDLPFWPVYGFGSAFPLHLFPFYFFFLFCWLFDGQVCASGLQAFPLAKKPKSLTNTKNHQLFFGTFPSSPDAAAVFWCFKWNQLKHFFVFRMFAFCIFFYFCFFFPWSRPFFFPSPSSCIWNFQWKLIFFYIFFDCLTDFFLYIFGFFFQRPLHHANHFHFHFYFYFSLMFSFSLSEQVSVFFCVYFLLVGKALIKKCKNNIRKSCQKSLARAASGNQEGKVN